MLNGLTVFTDFHHEALLNSLILLFENRLGGRLYRPIGLEWHTEGFWKVYDHPDTAKQFLQVNSVPTDGTTPLNSTRDSLSHTITLEQFKSMKFDIIIASIPEHVEPFIKLRDLYQPQAKLIFQIGNAWHFDTSFPVKNLLASAIIPVLPGFNQVTYHQEFSLDTYRYEPPSTAKKIYSFINCLGAVDLYKEDWELFLGLEKLMPDWEFKSFGGQCRDGWYSSPEDIANKMREATFIFHTKKNGDGYGYIIHQAAAVGRPLITRYSDYKDKLAGPLINNLTSLQVDTISPSDIALQLEHLVKINAVSIMGDQIHKVFKENVDFDAEQKKIELFLENLL